MYEPGARTVYVNDPSNVACMEALLGAILPIDRPIASPLGKPPEIKTET